MLVVVVVVIVIVVVIVVVVVVIVVSCIRIHTFIEQKMELAALLNYFRISTVYSDYLNAESEIMLGLEKKSNT